MKHLRSENIPEPRHATVLKTITVLDHFSALDQVMSLLVGAGVLMALGMVTNQVTYGHKTPHTHVFGKPMQTKSQLLSISKGKKKTKNL